MRFRDIRQCVYIVCQFVHRCLWADLKRNVRVRGRPQKALIPRPRALSLQTGFAPGRSSLTTIPGWGLGLSRFGGAFHPPGGCIRAAPPGRDSALRCPRRQAERQATEQTAPGGGWGECSHCVLGGTARHAVPTRATRPNEPPRSCVRTSADHNGSAVSRKPCKCRTRVGCRSLRRALASIWRMRSRVTLYILPISSSVRS